MTEGLRLAGRRVGITADRRWRAQADLLKNQGAEVLHGPTIRTVDLSGDEALRRATLDLIARPPDWLVASTGMGMTMWLEAADGWELGGPLRTALARARVVARGAKADSVLRRQGFEVEWEAPSETMDEVVGYLSGQGAGSARNRALRGRDRLGKGVALAAELHLGLLRYKVVKKLGSRSSRGCELWTTGPRGW